jgi:AMP phosphorylase
MRLKARRLNMQAGGKSIAVLDEVTSSSLGSHSSDRLKISYKDNHVVAIVNVAANFPHESIGLYEETWKKLRMEAEEDVEVQLAMLPESLHYIQAKIRNERLRETEIDSIIEDVVERHLSDIELSSFLTALYIHGLSMDEIEALTKAMVRTGSTLSLGKKPILDKHSIGGIPGDKTSILVVPIIAAAGFTIPKTSSRAVTSPAGTADRVETLCPVNLSVEEMREVVEKTNGCMVWGGALDLAPADDLFIQIEYPLAIDPMLLPSIMSKKKAIGATHVVLDLPTGAGAKITTIGEADALAADFIDLGKRLGICVQCGVTFGEQPLGNAVGPALEAREALAAIMGNGPADLLEKATSLAGILLEMVGKERGKQVAEELLKSGKAEEKLKQIIQAQGGDSRLKPEDIAVGDKKSELIADKDGEVLRISNEDIAKIAKEAGAPKDKGAGLLLKVKLGDRVKKGKVLFEIIAERSTKLESAVKLANKLQPVVLSKKPEDRMLMERIPTRVVHKKTFILER